MKINFTCSLDLYNQIQNRINDIKSDESFEKPISKSEYKFRKSVRKTEFIENSLNLSHDEKIEDSKEMKIFKFRQNYDWIKKDVKRTFHDENFKKIEGEKKLSRILESLSFILDEIGYVQGMNFIAGSLLLQFEKEEDAFFVFYIFLRKYDLIHLYKKVNITN